MFDQTFALVVHDRLEPCGLLEPVLRGLTVAAKSVGSTEDLRDSVARHRPALIFVDLPVWSRSAPEIISLAWSADPIPNVIVVGLKPDIELYVSTIERGAYSYVAPPFSCDRLRLTVSSALADVRGRREALGRSHFTGLGSTDLTPNGGRGLQRPSEYQVVSFGAGKHSAQ